jgi:hypothetical protein
MEELRRERDQAADKYSAPVAGPRPHAVTAQRTPVNKPALSPALRRFIRSA